MGGGGRRKRGREGQTERGSESERDRHTERERETEVWGRERLRETKFPLFDLLRPKWGSRKLKGPRLCGFEVKLEGFLLIRFP